jgi:hypothetical protein
MIDNLTFENFLINCSRDRFNSIVRLLLRVVFHTDATNVDAKGDAGGDFVVIPVDGGPRTFVCQVTVQDQAWERKVLSDADKAIKKMDCTRYFYFTSRRRESAKLRALESEISTKYGVPATCLGGKEISELLISKGLIVDAMETLGITVPSSLRSRIDRSEILLHSFVALGSETAELRDQVYDDTLLVILRDAGAKAKDTLVTEAISLLGCDLAREGRFRKRIDSLLSRQWITKNKETGELELSPQSRQALETSEKIYAAEMDSLASSQAALLEREHGIEWPPDSAHKCSVFLARAFIKRHLETIEASQVHVNRLQLTAAIGDPVQELRNYLSVSGVSVRRVNGVLAELASNAAESPLINKLVRGALYAALEGQNSLQASRVLGVSNWEEVTVILDASVLIPYICAKMFRPTLGRFSSGAIQCVDVFRQSGAKVVTTHDYINETSAHLLKALQYCHLKDSDQFLAYSTNGYVSHYYQMREKGISVPEDLLTFLVKFSRVLLHEQETDRWIRAIMTDVQRLASEFGISYEHLKHVDAHYSDKVDREYGFIQDKRQMSRAGLLFKHDARTLSSMRKNTALGMKGQMCLTWDRTMIEVARKVADCGWVVSPHDACDFIQLSRPPTDQKLIALSHKLAGARERPSEIVGELLDRLVQVAKPEQMEWELRDRLESLRQELLGRVDTTSKEYDDWSRQKKYAFLEELGLSKDVMDAESHSSDTGADALKSSALPLPIIAS